MTMAQLFIPEEYFSLQAYNYELPEELIAKYPPEERDRARLLLVDRQRQSFEHRIFRELPELLQAGDTLVLNDTKVIPARFFGHKANGTMAEVFLLEDLGDSWRVLVKPGRRIHTGTQIILNEEWDLTAQVEAELDFPGGRLLSFNQPPETLARYIDQCGNMPLPPYIRRPAEPLDKEAYQTIYAHIPGSVAAPTAGLHFTRDLLNKLQDRGINIAYLLLHVGIGTFRPVSSVDIRDHKMHSEHYSLSAETARLLNRTRTAGKKIIAVGTTVVRTLETVYCEPDGFQASAGETDKYIYPGYAYQAIDGMVTNFHLPESSLLMLVAAFAGYDLTMQAYQQAIAERYKFYSYGDAMLMI